MSGFLIVDAFFGSTMVYCVWRTGVLERIRVIRVIPANASSVITNIVLPRAQV